MEAKRRIPESELVINSDGSIYHLHLKPENIADDIIVVGDPGRVAVISAFFDQVDFKVESREFVTHTGWYKGKRITALATGIGTDNIDIVLNELDAIVNIDLETRTIKDEHRSLNIVRIGTCGAMQEDIPVESFVVSAFGLGMDGLLHYYKYQPDPLEQEILDTFKEQTQWNENAAKPYVIAGSTSLIQKVGHDMHRCVTATAPGFYGPQGRKLRLDLHTKDLNEQLTAFNHRGLRVGNFEMETSALYGLGKMLGHNCCTVCVAIANRLLEEYSPNYQPALRKLIVTVLDRLTSEG